MALYMNMITMSVLIGFCYFCHITCLCGVAGGRWQIRLGSVTLSVKQGDITRESTDAIVNSSNAQLQLNMGDVIFSFVICPFVMCEMRLATSKLLMNIYQVASLSNQIKFNCFSSVYS